MDKFVAAREGVTAGGFGVISSAPGRLSLPKIPL
jgi:hypothetical protein